MLAFILNFVLGVGGVAGSWREGEVKCVGGWTSDKDESRSCAQVGSILEGASSVRGEFWAVQ